MLCRPEDNKTLLYIMGEMLGYTPNMPKGPIKPSSNNYSHYRNISSNLTFPVRVWSGHVYCELFNQTSNINKLPTGNVTGLRGAIADCCCCEEKKIPVQMLQQGTKG